MYHTFLKRTGFFGVVFVLIVTQLPLVAINTKTHAEEQNIWGGSIVLSSEEEAPSGDNKGNTICERGTVRKRLVPQHAIERKADGSIVLPGTGATQQMSDFIDGCIVQNSQGLFAGEYWSPSGNPAQTMRLVHASGASFDPAPAGNVVLMRTNSPAGYYLSVNYGIEGVGRLDANGQDPAELQWRLLNPADSLRYADGSLVQFLNHAFSQNGRYLVAHLAQSSYLVRIDLKTLTMTPIAFGASSYSRLSVSSNGDYVLSYRPGQLLLHDLIGCASSYQHGDWPAAGVQYEGCTEQNIYNEIAARYPEVGNGQISRLRFGLNSASMSVDGGWRHPDGEYRWRRFTFTPENYTPSVQGYLAMGDSFSSGEGDTEGGSWYEPGTDEQGDKNTFEGRNLCHLSRRSYPYLLAVEFGYLADTAGSTPANGLFHSVACSGAKIHNLVGGSDANLLLGEGSEQDFENTENQFRNDNLGSLGLWQPGRIKQLDFIDEESRGSEERAAFLPEAISLGIGGNDTGFGELISSCIASSTCDPAIPGSEAAYNLALRIASTKRDLVKTFTAVKHASPNSQLYVHGYPALVQYGGDCGINVRLDTQETILADHTVRYLNSVVEAAAQEIGAVYIDVTNMLSGSNLCSSAPEEGKTVNGVTAGNDTNTTLSDIASFGICRIRNGCFGKESFHPNQAAHELYVDVIKAQTDNLTKIGSDPQQTNIPLPDVAFFGQDAADMVNEMNSGGGSFTIPLPSSIVQTQSEALEVIQTELLPGSMATIELHSDPLVLGTYIVPENGTLTESITLPAGIEAGAHAIHVIGVDKHGKPVEYFEPILVQAAQNDFDGDGVVNDVDSCVTIHDSGSDADGDGVDDVCDVSVAGVEPPEPPQSPDDRNCSVRKKVGKRKTKRVRTCHWEVLKGEKKLVKKLQVATVKRKHPKISQPVKIKRRKLKVKVYRDNRMVAVKIRKSASRLYW